ncbi:6,7-dimethyl-8-ribityllumazine synthase [Paracidobacterium acidisoli]|uniref:6,7-dimethyl-8-ribityllumazine synthase n=1 Tax=Paracidobacterium acidisoli TaxID=2303751 RepID=A0A372IPN1_9BACT|nr:6,7-dimethyl-8-ribityllumazine synthase [Paracidobacterium acidisoli]MBT9331137.1 6,7-dimethyl-8-ribityllumazine synthase [Paracidobacterium acidisoli]
MVKGITCIQPVASTEQLALLESFFSALGFEPGKGWDDASGRGRAFLAPVGNLELIEGELPSQKAGIFVEVTSLDSVRETTQAWLKKHAPSAALDAIADTDWKSRLFAVEPVPGFSIAFWEWQEPLRGRPVALEGDLSAEGMKFAIIVARWNAVITDRLLQGALDCLYRSGAKKEDVQVLRVPGAWEIPSAARKIAESKTVDAVITLGLLLRGETAHYEAIYNEVSRGIGQSQQETGIPHAFGVLTCETLEQALDRAGLKAGNKGFEAASAAIEMVSLHKKIEVKTGAKDVEQKTGVSA